MFRELQHGQSINQSNQSISNQSINQSISNQSINQSISNQLINQSISNESINQSKQLNLQALGIRSRNLPPGHRDTLVSMNNLAEVHKLLGEFQEAEELSMKIIQIAQEQHSD